MKLKEAAPWKTQEYTKRIHNVLTARFEFVAKIATVVDSITRLLVVQQTFTVVADECTICTKRVRVR